MNEAQFQALAAQGYNRIPVMREVLADLDTPLSTYLKLADGPYSYLLESVQGGEKWGRYSIIGLPCRVVVRIRGNEITVIDDGEVVERHERIDPLAWVEEFRIRYRVPELAHLPRFTGLFWLRHGALYRAATTRLSESGSAGHAGHPSHGVG